MTADCHECVPCPTHLVHDIEILHQLLALTRLPVCLVAHQDNVGLQLANAGGLHQSSSARLKVFAVDQGIETLDAMLAEPAGGAFLQIIAILLRARAAQHMATDQQREILCQHVGKVHEHWPSIGQTGEHQDLWPVVLHMILHIIQLLHRHQRILVGLRLRRGAPVDIGLAIGDN